MTTLRHVAEIGVGLLYGVGACFNAVYTLRHGDEFYGGFLKAAWHPPARWFLRVVVLPNATVFTLLVMLFQVAVAILILGRGDLVEIGLLAGATFAALAAVVSSPAGTAGNAALAAIQIVLALAR